MESRKKRALGVFVRSARVTRFSVDDYLNNPPLIEKLNEEKQLAIVSVESLTAQLDSAKAQTEELRLENQALRHQVNASIRQASSTFAFSLVAVLLCGLGVNIATTKPTELLGWALVALGALIEIFAFLSKPRAGGG